jgi:hypothetical protein
MNFDPSGGSQAALVLGPAVRSAPQDVAAAHRTRGEGDGWPVATSGNQGAALTM